jgi:hydroxymethylpyrimidine/phosphomethylpyrimidine kinase
MRHALTIAGSDSGGGAGVQADLKTFAAFRVYGTSAITAVTAQNTLGVTGTAALSADLVTAQIEAIAGDIRIDATKIGMLATAAIVEAVASAIEELDLPMVVLDPVMVSSSGERLLDDDGIQALRVELLPRARIVTPNIPEAEVLSGCRILSLGDRRRAAERIHQYGAAAVVITGGHGDGPVSDIVVDLLFDGESFTELKTPRASIHGGHGLHGTGCAFSSALAAGLALGELLVRAAGSAQRYVAGAIEHSVAIGHGARVLNHFWQNQSTDQ